MKPVQIRFLLVLPLFSLLMAEEQTKFLPSWDSLDTRPVPSWYPDAKFGIFIHWGVYSVPAWAPKDKYAEWYWHWMGTQTEGVGSAVEESPTLQYHKSTFGTDVVYPDFVQDFKTQMFDPVHWANVFKRSGARYVVLTSKHHDGFCLFESKEANTSWGRPWNSVDAGPHRDLLGDLGQAVRDAGLKMGFYYSLYEWYNPLWRLDKKLYVEKHMLPQFKDVVTRYKPAILFSDGEWEMDSVDWKSEAFLAWLFNESSVKDEVVVNDRWGRETRHKHGTYYTTEYAAGMSDTDHPWEENRGMGRSYGYNRNETLADYRTGRELILTLVDMVSRGGNLLLNVGPTADGRLPVIMEQRLMEIGDWLSVNGEAIFGTRPWIRSQQWSEGVIPKVEYGGSHMVQYEIGKATGLKCDEHAVIEAFFTRKEDHLFAITPQWPSGPLRLKGITPKKGSSIYLIGFNEPLEWRVEGSDLLIQTPLQALKDSRMRNLTAYSFKITLDSP